MRRGGGDTVREETRPARSALDVSAQAHDPQELLVVYPDAALACGGVVAALLLRSRVAALEVEVREVGVARQLGVARDLGRRLDSNVLEDVLALDAVATDLP